MANLSSIDVFFLICAVIGGALFLVRTVLFFVGGIGDTDLDGDIGGVDLDLDGDIDPSFNGGLDDSLGDTDTSFRILSVQGITAFFMMFGLVGLAVSTGAQNSFLAVLGGFASGMAAVWFISKIYSGMTRLQADGTMKFENAAGKEGTVYLKIPKGGTGQVRVSVQGALRVLDAISVDGEEIKTGENIRVEKIVSGNILVVRKFN